MENDRSLIERLATDLRRLGIRPGDVVMVHASLRALGAADGRADAVLDALAAAVGTEGTLLMVLGAKDDSAWVNDRPESERPELLRDAEPFDALITRADPEVGALAEAFRTRRGTRVSNHPEGRFAASGPLAEHLVDAVPWDDYFGPGSPLERFVHANGRVLRLGADFDTVTLLHYAEYLAAVPSKRRVRRHRLVAGRTGPELRVVSSLDDNNGIADYTGEDYFTAILRQYLATGQASQGAVGPARSELLEASNLVEFAVTWMTEHLAGP